MGVTVGKEEADVLEVSVREPGEVGALLFAVAEPLALVNVLHL